MRGLRLVIVLAVGLMLLLPPRWCCALPAGFGPCGANCQSTPGKACCACAKQGDSKSTPKSPCKCACKGSIAKMGKSPDRPDVVPPTFVAAVCVEAPSLDPLATALILDELLPPLDLQITLRRWRC